MLPPGMYSSAMNQHGPKRYAIYGEYARGSNVVMKDGLNRRVFNKVEAESGPGISLNDDGSITVTPGTYRITGYSMVTMQATFAPPVLKNDNNYPGYCLLYLKTNEGDGANLPKQALSIGSPSTAADMAPSLFDAIHTFPERTDICLGHQAGDDLQGEVYLSVYEVNGIPSEYHVVARIAITEM
jgi:hypothetical protein